MMIRLGSLVVRDLVHGRRAWIALFVCVLGMGVVFALSLGLVIVGAGATGEAQDAYVTIGGVALGFSVMTGVVNLAQVARISVSLRRRSVALWRVAGVLPGQAFVMTLAQVVGVCACGGVVAMMAAPVAWGPFAAFVRGTDLPAAPGLSEAVPRVATMWAAVVSVLVGILGGLFAARSAARRDVLDGLSDARATAAGPRRGVKGVLGAVLVMLVLAGTITLYWAISRVPVRATDELGDFLMVYPGMGILLLGVLALVGRWCVAMLARIGVGATPAGRAPLPAYLACRQAASRLDHTRGLVMPVVYATAVTGIVLAWTGKLTEILSDAGAGEAVRAPADQLALLIGGALVIAVIASSSVSYASMDVRVKDAALLSAMGARPAVLYRQALAEACVYAVMAASIAYTAIGANEWVMTAVLTAGPVPSAPLDPLPWEPLILIACAFVLHAVNLLSVSGYAVGRDPVATLARSST